MPIGGIGAIGAYSTSMSPIEPVSRMNYQVKNQSEVSDAFSESASRIGGADPMGAVGLAQPVQYANSTYNPDAITEKANASVEANAAYNSLANSFAGATTGYDASSAALAYQSVGGNLDLYA